MAAWAYSAAVSASKGWHGTRDDFKRHNVDELDILADTIELIAKNNT